MGDAAVGESPRLEAALAAIDAANAADPNTLRVGGVDRPKELLHSELMSAWLHRLDPDADELQQLAARASHFRRWTRPRSEYPDGRSGYLRWRADAKRHHAAESGELLARCGYSSAEIERVGAIILKEGLGTDPAVQVHEDALCLVFLETQLDSTADRLGEDEMVSVLARTIPKLSGAGLRAATTLALTDRGAGLLSDALELSDGNERNER